MGTEPSGSGKIKVDEHYPSELDEPPPFDVKRIENIRANVKFDTLYQVTKLLGDGKFGKVYCVIEKATGKEFAAKFIKIRKEADRAEVEREVSILTQLRHPRIAQIYDAFYSTTNDVVLIMEIVRGGELFDRVAEESYELSELAVVMIICQLCEAIDYIHKQNILHLDVKPENIMCVSLTGNRIKLIDFGLARHYDGTQELKYMAGTPEFAAPEVIKFEKLDFHTDMWSIGVITYILLSGYSPFLGDNLGETYCNVEKGEWEFTEEFDTVSSEAKDFISKLLVYDQRKRMLPHECLQHPWIAKHRQKASCNSILEKPLNAPQLDNKQIMRYNAKRKFRRMIIYVKFLIEMNRLRNSLKTRMSTSGHKFFDPLLKMAEKKEQKISDVCNSSAPTTSIGLNSLVQKAIESKRKGSEASHLSHLGKIQEEDSNTKKDKDTGSVDAVMKRKKSVPKENKDGTDTTKKKSRVSITSTMPEEIQKTDATPEREKTLKTLEIAENGDVVLKKKKKKKPSIDVSVGGHVSVPFENKVNDSGTKKLSVGTELNMTKRKNSKKSVDNQTEKGNSITPSVALNLEKETLNTVRTEKRASKTESVDSSKENEQSTEVKKPSRQGALKKREKSTDNVLNSAPAPTTLSSRKDTETSVKHLIVETAKTNGDVIKSEKILTKKNSSVSKPKSGEQKLQIQVIEDKEKLPDLSTTVVNFESKPTKKVSSKILKLISAKSKDDSEKEKKPVKLSLTTEKSETTTVHTTTSVKRVTQNSENKVEHISKRKSVESTQKKKSQEDNLKISQVTTKKEESPNSNSITVKRNVINQILNKTLSEKEIKTTEKKDEEKVVKKKNSIKEKDDVQCTLIQTVKVNGEKEENSKLSGKKKVTKKLEVNNEETVGPRKSSLKKVSANLSNEVKKQVEIRKGNRTGTLKVTENTKIDIVPKASDDSSTNNSLRINVSGEQSLRSSVKSHVSSISTRDSSEERKKVRFVGDVNPKIKNERAEPLLGGGLQKMKSESCIHKKLPDYNASRKLRDDVEITRKGSLFTDVEYLPREDFSFDNLKEKLLRRVSGVDEHLNIGNQRKPISIPPTNSVKDRLRQFESRMSK